MEEKPVRFLGWEDPLEEGTETHFSVLDWKIPWREETSRLQSIGWQRVRHDWSASMQGLGLQSSKIYHPIVYSSAPNQSLIDRHSSFSSIFLLLKQEISLHFISDVFIFPVYPRGEPVDHRVRKFVILIFIPKLFVIWFVPIYHLTNNIQCLFSHTFVNSCCYHFLIFANLRSEKIFGIVF